MRNGVAWEHFTETLTSGSDLKAGEEGALVASGKRVLQAEGTGCAKALGQECACLFEGRTGGWCGGALWKWWAGARSHQAALKSLVKSLFVSVGGAEL